jgi:hypothetical protein
MRVYTFSTRNRPIGLLAGFLILGAGLALLVLGVAVLAGIAIVGAVLGTGIILYRMLRGRPVAPLQRPRTSELDPSLEVFAEPRALDASDETRRSAPDDPRRIPPA